MRLLLVLAFLMLASCEKAEHVARCVEHCEKLPAGCEYDRTTFFQGTRYCMCLCSRSFNGNDTSWSK